MRQQIVVTSPSGVTRRIRLENSCVSVGRSSSNDLSYPEEPGLSRKHMILEKEGSGWVVRDLGSRNGTFVNGVRISDKHLLEPGDRITACNVALVYREGDTDSTSGSVVFDTTHVEATGPPAKVTKLEEILSSDTLAPSARRKVSSRGWSSPVTALIRAGRELAMQRPLAELFEIILDLAIEAVGAERGVLLTSEGDELVVQASRGENFRISTAVRDRVLQQKHSLLVRDVAEHQELKLRESIVRQGTRTLMAAPFQTDYRVTGLIYVDSPSLTCQFASEDLDLLTVMANVAAMRVELLRLHEVERTSQLLANELRQAAEIQRQCLPAHAPSVPGVELAGYNAACRTVGGDYYDFFQHQDGRISIMLADVAGKGMPASLLMMNLQARVQQVLAHDASDPAEVTSRLNRSLCSTYPVNRFVSMFWCVLDPTGGEMTYCNAGHNFPLLVRPNATIEQLKGGGPVLGVLPDASYQIQRRRLEPGDALVVYSDGVTEATNPQGEEFGEERLAAVCSSCERAETILQAVNQAVKEWLAGAPAEDDITLVTVVKQG